MRGLCLLPGIASFLGYSLYPMMIERLDMIDAVERLLGPSWMAAQIVENADALILALGIALSATCWFYAERVARARTRARCQV